MTGFDYAVFAILGISFLVGAFRGLIKELVTLAGWASAFVLSGVFGGTLARQMPASLGPMLASLLAYLAIFIGTLLLAGLIAMVLSKLANSAGLGITNRSLGALFGFLRGLLILLALVLLGGLTPLPREPFWRDAMLSGPIETAVVAMRPLLPEGLAQRVKFR